MSHLTIEEKAQAIREHGHHYVHVIGDSHTVSIKLNSGNRPICIVSKDGKAGMEMFIPPMDLVGWMNHYCDKTMYWEKVE